MVGRTGFSMVELLIVGALLASLATLGGFAYHSYLKSVKRTLSEQQHETVIEQVSNAVGLVSRGADAGLRSTVTGYPITDMSTCDDFMAALKVRLWKLRNPYDGSPAVTFSSGYDWEHKRGKIRITCFKLNRAGPYNGGACKMNKAGIRVTYYHLDCGGACNSPSCQYPGSGCGGATEPGWVYGGQTDKFFGGYENRYLKMPGGAIIQAPWGGPMPDYGWAQAECGSGYGWKIIPKEPDY